MLKKLIEDKKFILIVSLPKNDIGLIKEALKAGADVIKVHINVSHFASKQKYGSFKEERHFLQEACALVKSQDKLLGVVAGDGGEYATDADLEAMADLGVDFISSYVEHAPLILLDKKDLELMAAVSFETLDYALEMQELGVDIIEASIVEHKEYHKDLSILDLCKYKRLTSLSNKPIIIPTQKNIKPSDIKLLANIGCKGIMIGSVVFEKNKDLSFYEVVKSYRDTINQL